MLIIPEFGRLRKKDRVIKASLNYRARPCLKINKLTNNKIKTTNLKNNY
jgi:hypothetical protein